MTDDLEEKDTLEVELLNKEDLECFDMPRTIYRVEKFIKRYKRLRLKNYSLPQIKITANYEYVYIDNKNHSNYSSIDKFLDDEKEYLEISAKLPLITKLMTEEEKVYFTITELNGKSKSRAYNAIGCSNRGLDPIRNSCLTKVALAFNLEVYKGDLIPSEQEEDDYKLNHEDNK